MRYHSSAVDRVPLLPVVAVAFVFVLLAGPLTVTYNPADLTGGNELPAVDDVESAQSNVQDRESMPARMQDAVFGSNQPDFASRKAALEVAIPEAEGAASTSGWHVFAYSRYDDSDPLQNDVRSQVFDAVVRSPGTYPAEVADAISVHRSTARYHLRILAEEGLVFGEKIRGRQRFFPSDSERTAVDAALADESLAPVVTAVVTLAPVSVSGLATELDRSPSTVSHHVSRLAEAGLVEKNRNGKRVDIEPTATLVSAVHLGSEGDSTADPAPATAE